MKASRNAELRTRVKGPGQSMWIALNEKENGRGLRENYNRFGLGSAGGNKFMKIRLIVC